MRLFAKHVKFAGDAWHRYLYIILLQSYHGDAVVICQIVVGHKTCYFPPPYPAPTFFRFFIYRSWVGVYALIEAVLMVEETRLCGRKQTEHVRKYNTLIWKCISRRRRELLANHCENDRKWETFPLVSISVALAVIFAPTECWRHHPCSGKRVSRLHITSALGCRGGHKFPNVPFTFSFVYVSKNRFIDLCPSLGK